jgi:hypothetical protein
VFEAGRYLIALISLLFEGSVHMKPSALRRKHVQWDQETLNRAKPLLGAKTDTEALERVLDMVVAEAEIEAVLKAAQGKGRFRKVFL